MDTIHNAVEKAKELFTPGESHATDKDIAKAAEREEDMQHKKILEQIAADKKIAKAAEKVEQRRHELNLQYIREASNINTAAGNCLEEQRKQQEVDVVEPKRLSFNDTYFTTGQEQSVVVFDPMPVHAESVTACSRMNTVAVAEPAARYDVSEKFDMEAYKQKEKTLEAEEKLDMEAYKQREKILEAEEKLAKAREELDRTIVKKEEKSVAADARINEAAERVATLQEQAHQSHETVIEKNTVEKAKEFFTSDESDATDIAKAAEREENMQHKKVVEEIAADKEIAKAAEKVEQKRHELSLQYMKEGNCLEEQRKQQEVDVVELKRLSFNDTYFTTGQEQSVVVSDPMPVHIETVMTCPGINTMPGVELVEQFDAPYDASKKLGMEAYKQKEKTLEAEEKLAKAREELDQMIVKKEEKSVAADARINEAADKVASLQEQAHQCHQAVIEKDTDEAADKVASLREHTHQHHEAVIDNDTDKLVIQGGPNFSPVLF